MSGKEEKKAETKAKSAEPTGPVYPVRVDNLTSRSDADALEGGQVKVLSGDHQGAKGVFDSVVEYGNDGYPTRVLVVFTDPAYKSGREVFDYGDIAPVDYNPDDSYAEEQAKEAENRVIPAVAEEPEGDG
jgi:hypothetical protein